MKTIAVIFGGKSTEHDVSIVTAISSIIQPLTATQNWKVVPIYISKNGGWYTHAKFASIQTFSSGKIDSLLSNLQPICIEIAGNELNLVQKVSIGRQKKTVIDIIFPATHGTYGEDGSLMGMARMCGVPIVGCDMEASCIAMNKLLAHQVVEAHGIKSHPYTSATKAEFENTFDLIEAKINTLDYPLYVKPVHLGSSIGITRIANKSELKDALNTVFSYDNVAIVEQAIPNLIEVTVPVIGTTSNPRAGLVERPLFDAESTFDFNAKYMQQGKGKSTKSAGAQGYSELPAKLPKDLYEASEALALRVYSAIGCYGIARVDLLIDSKTNQIFFNEINPLPGSLYMHNWRAAGISNVELVDELVDLAEQREIQQAQTATAFETNFLKQF